MSWFLLGLIPPAIWSVSNHLDKFLLEKFFKGEGIGALMIFSSLIGIVIMTFIALIKPDILRYPPKDAILITLNGFLYVTAMLPYFYALQKSEASIVTALFQLIPLFTFFLAWVILRETLTLIQIIGGLFIILGAVGISVELKENKKLGFKLDIFLLMSLSSLLISFNFIFFKLFTKTADFWVISFYEYLGFIIFAFILIIFIKSYRKEFLAVLKQNSVILLSLNGINEILNIIAKLTLNYVSLFTSITLAWVINGFQPLFAFLFGVILTVFFPHIAQEKISRKDISQKLIAICIIFVGAYLINIH